VLQLLAQGQLKLPGGTKRIGSEAEVTLYGALPRADARVLLRWPLPQPHLHTHNQELEDVYGIRADSVGTKQLADLRDIAAVLARHPNDSATDRLLRQWLARYAGRRIVGALAEQFNFIVGLDEQIFQR
jgi:hypothetical protein